MFAKKHKIEQAIAKINRLIVDKQLPTLIKAYCDQDPEAKALLETPGLDHYWHERAKKLMFAPDAETNTRNTSRSSFDVFIGKYCFIQAILSGDQQDRQSQHEWLVRGKSFQDADCLRALGWQEVWRLSEVQYENVRHMLEKGEPLDPEAAIELLISVRKENQSIHEVASLAAFTNAALAFAQHYQDANENGDTINRFYAMALFAIKEAMNKLSVTIKQCDPEITSPRRLSLLYSENAALEEIKENCYYWLNTAGANHN